jgi:predicted SnoaL-like aldol condensation-catalyzing enzyme
MPINHFPVGLEMDVNYPDFKVSLTLLSASQLKFEIKEGPLRHTEIVDINVIALGNSIFAVSWQEQDGATVTNVQDYDRGLIHSHATLSDGRFLRMTGTIVVTRAANQIFDDRPQRNKALVIEAMTSLFQRRDVSAIERLYAENYVQHNPDIPQGRDALQAIVAGLPQTIYYEPGLAIAEGEIVAIHGRIRGWADKPQVVVDLFRIENGKLAEHWDVLQDEVSHNAAFGRVSMFDPEEASRGADKI